jgi:RimJ/RimL family protein N-acetyltransferase
MNTQERIVLENGRVRLEPLEIGHLSSLLPIALAYPNLLKYGPSPFGSQENLEKYFKAALTGREDQVRYPFVIYDKKVERFVGSTSFGNISPANLRIEIGWTWLDPAVQGTGINKFCKHLLLTYAFETLQYKRVEFKADVRNVKSRKAMEKIGAKYEGILRSHTLMLDGSRRDTVYYSILEEEWTDLRESVFSDIF